jgi:hypothetical protein
MKDLHNAPDELLTALLDNIPAHYDDKHKEHAAFVLEKNWQWVEPWAHNITEHHAEISGLNFAPDQRAKIYRYLIDYADSFENPARYAGVDWNERIIAVTT